MTSPSSPAPPPFQTASLPAEPTAVAPDGSAVRRLLATSAASMAQFEFQPGVITPCVRHRTVEELWYVLSGDGRMWRAGGGREETVVLEAGVAVTIGVGTRFQIRTTGDDPLRVVGTTIPPWPPDGDAEIVDGRWTPTPGETQPGGSCLPPSSR
ncbi:MAG: cupin domain-containing protein [Acidimicrobiia bacterium]|nr:cupin domain-containing protein [Acidimicrobiia bacterium]